MCVDCCLAAIGIGNHLIQKCGIAGLGEILVNSGKQPQCIVCTVSGMPGLLYIRSIVRGVLMAGVMGELDQRQAAVVHLRRQHKADLVCCLFRCQMDHTLNVLHSVTVPVTIAQTAINKGSRTGPCKGHEAVISMPCVDHAVHGSAGGIDLEIFQLTMPVCLQLCQFLCADVGRIGVPCHQLCRFCTIFHAHKESQMLGLARLQGQNSR